jgi:alpha-ribazole phosphatase
MMELWLVRHGQTDWNLQGRYQGHTDLPLNAQGLRQADDLAARLRGAEFTAIYSSDLQRAYATAQAIAGDRRQPVTVDPRLREANLGVWEGMVVADIMHEYPDAWAWRQRDPVHARPPGGESLLELAARVAAAVDDLAERHAGGPLLVVAHGLALATLVCRAHGHDLGRAYDLIPENAHPLVIDWPAPTVPELETSRHELSR